MPMEVARHNHFAEVACLLNVSASFAFRVMLLSPNQPHFIRVRLFPGLLFGIKAERMHSHTLI